MASSYDAIREENVKRYGTDVDLYGPVLLEKLYNERTHFIYELLQNAEDAGATEIDFRLFQDRLEVHHNGRLFNEADVRGICGLVAGTKSDDLTQIGQFGIGFKSVYAFTHKPEIHSGNEHFFVENYVRPFPTDPFQIFPNWTTFVFRFDREDVRPDQAYSEIAYRLENLGNRTLLFLRSIKKVSWHTLESFGNYVRRSQSERPIGAGLLARMVEVTHQSADGYERWLIFSRPVAYSGSDLRVEAGFLLRESDKDFWEITPLQAESRLVVFFPTDKNTGLGCLIQGPFRTTPARDNIPSDDGFNEFLMGEVGELLVQVLLILQGSGRLTISVLETMPLKGWEFVNTIFSPLYERVKNAFFEHELLPANSGHYVSADDARLARGAGLIDLLSDELLTQLFGSDTRLFWLSPDITDSSPLWRYLTENLRVPVIRPETFASAISEVFLDKQLDEWVVRFYQYLAAHRDLWTQRGVVRNRPIIRLENGAHRAPFDEEGKPQVFLPSGHDTDFPTVRQALCDDEEALQFLGMLGLSEPNLIDEVERFVLPKYESRKLLEPPDSYWRDLTRIFYALRGEGERQRRLVDRLNHVDFMYASHAGNADRALQSPEELYEYSEELGDYFQDNVDVWFVAQDILEFVEAKGFRDEFNKLRIGTEVRIHEGHVKPDRFGRVVFKKQHGDHARGVDRFNPLVRIEGLEHALEHITPDKARYIWNEILPRIWDSIRGTVELSTRQEYFDPEREERLSKAGEVLVKYPWLPDRDGGFHRPGELAIDDLPDDFEYIEKLARQLGMLGDQIKESAEKLGLPEALLRTLASDPAIINDVEEFVKKRTKSRSAPLETTYGDELRRAFLQAGNPASLEETPLAALSDQNLDRRREKVREDIEGTMERGDSSDSRPRVSVTQRCSTKDDYIRTYLYEEYRGICQMGGETFTTAGGIPYFETVPLVDRLHAAWIDRPGNYLCLSADFAARWQYGPKSTEEDIIAQILYADEQNPILRIQLCGESVEIRYAPKHLLELQEMARISPPEG